MYNHLIGKVALVTGSTRGIGLGIAQKLASQGTNLIINGFGDPKEINVTKQQLEQDYKIKVLYDTADMKDGLQIKKMVERARQEIGPIQILINNAGMQHISPLEQFDDKIFKDIVDINYLSVFHTCKNTIPDMKQLGWGRIINISSVHGLVASVNKSAYVSSKHAVIGLTKSLGLELAKTGVTCNAICPGWVMTELIQKQIQLKGEEFQLDYEQAKIKLLEEKQPSLSAAQIDDIAEITLFLCSKAASQIIGSSITVDGGWTAQ